MPMDDIEIDFEIEEAMPLLVGYVDEEGDFNVQIDTDQLGSAENVGIVLAAIEQHMAGALAHAGLAPTEDGALTAIRNAYQAEIANPTNHNDGGML